MKEQVDFFDPIRDLPAFVALCDGRAYAGIGSRDTPNDVLRLMTRIGKWLGAKRVVLRSGGAEGADSAFERGQGTIGPKEIFLPWNGFNGRAMQRGLLGVDERKAYEIAEKHHPAWHRLSDVAKKLTARNAYQILGATCADPSAFVVCWTSDGAIAKTTRKTGGTGQAIRIAHTYGIPVFNLQRADHRDAWERFVELR